MHIVQEGNQHPKSKVPNIFWRIRFTMDETKMKVLIMGLAICLPLIMINFANFPDTIHEAIKRDDFEAVEKFISMDQSLLNSKNSFGNTPLINAVKFGSPVMVDELMKYTKTENGGPGILDANIKDVFDESPLYIASKNGFDKIVGVFVYNYPDSVDFLASNGRNYTTALHVAVQNGHFETARLVASRMVMDSKDATPKNMLINVKDGNGKTPLYLAVEFENLEIVRNLLFLGADKNAKNGKNGTTALQHAAQKGYDSIAQALVNEPRIERIQLFINGRFTTFILQGCLMRPEIKKLGWQIRFFPRALY